MGIVDPPVSTPERELWLDIDRCVKCFPQRPVAIHAALQAAIDHFDLVPANMPALAYAVRNMLRHLGRRCDVTPVYESELSKSKMAVLKVSSNGWAFPMDYPTSPDGLSYLWVRDRAGPCTSYDYPVAWIAMEAYIDEGRLPPFRSAPERIVAPTASLPVWEHLI